jgi:hypothetical protein
MSTYRVTYKAKISGLIFENILQKKNFADCEKAIIDLEVYELRSITKIS